MNSEVIIYFIGLPLIVNKVENVVVCCPFILFHLSISY